MGSLSVAGTLIVVALLRSKREHWRGPTLFLWGLVLAFLSIQDLREAAKQKR
jgi:hypothetical protein